MVFPVTAPGVFEGAEPNFGGTLGIKYATLEYTDTTAKELFTLPSGAVILDFWINVSVAFNDTGTDLVDIRDSTTDDRYVAALDVSPIGLLTAQSDPTELMQDPYTEPVVVEGLFTGSNADASAGTAVVTVIYALYTPA